MEEMKLNDQINARTSVLCLCAEHFFKQYFIFISVESSVPTLQLQ